MLTRWLILSVCLYLEILLVFRATSCVMSTKPYHSLQQFHAGEWRNCCGERGSANGLCTSGVIAIQPRAPLRFWTWFAQIRVKNIPDYVYAKLSAAAQ
jgi:hypothetical protein